MTKTKKSQQASGADVTVTYEQLHAARQVGALEALYAENLPGRLIEIVKFGIAVSNELAVYDEAVKRLIAQFNGQANGNGINFGTAENAAAADVEFQSLLKTEVKLRAPRLTQKELEQACQRSGSPLRANHIMKLIWLTDLE